MFSLGGIVYEHVTLQLFADTVEAQSVLNRWLKDDEKVAMVLPQLNDPLRDDSELADILLGVVKAADSALEGVNAAPAAMAADAVE